MYEQVTLNPPLSGPPSTGHLSGDVAMVNMVLTGIEKHMLGHMHRKAYAWSRARGRMYMHKVHVCMYVCIYMYAFHPAF